MKENAATINGVMRPSMFVFINMSSSEVRGQCLGCSMPGRPKPPPPPPELPPDISFLVVCSFGLAWLPYGLGMAQLALEELS